MTTSSITSTRRTPGQTKQYNRFVDDARDRALVVVNPDKDATQRLIAKGGEFQTYVIEGIRKFSGKQPDYTLAQSILGADFISAEEIVTARPGIVYSPEQITMLSQSIPSEETLRCCKDNGYAVMPAPPSEMSLLGVRDTKNTDFYSQTEGWYANQKFARKDTTSFGWLAIRKTEVPGSTNKNWDEQNKLLSALEYVPNTATMSWFITTYFAVRGVRLFERMYVRTSSLDSDGDRVCVGAFGDEGLPVRNWSGGMRHVSVGLSSARKF
jgi:hypothetical protein